MDALSTTSKSKHARRRANRRTRSDLAIALNEVYALWTPGVVSANAEAIPSNRWDRKVRQLYHSVCDTEGKEAAAVFMRSLVFRANEPARHPDFFADLIGSARQLGVPILFAVKLPLTPQRGGRRCVVTHRVSEAREVTNKSPRDGVGRLAPVRGGRNL
jgi:hypothetical protein